MAKFLKTMTTLSFCLAVFGPEGAEANYSVSTKLGESDVYSEDNWYSSIQYNKLVEKAGKSRFEYEPAFGLNDGINAVFKKINKHEERVDPASYYTFGENGVKTEYIRISQGQNAFITAEVSSTEARSSEFSNGARSERGSLRSQSPIHAIVESSSEISDYTFEVTDVVHSESGGTSCRVFDISPDTRAVTPCEQIFGTNIFRRDADKYYELLSGNVVMFVQTFSAIAFLDGNRVFERKVGNGLDLDELPLLYDGIDKEAYFIFAWSTFAAIFERFGETFYIGKDRITLYVVKDATYPTEVDTYSLTEVPTSQQNGLNHNGLRSKYVNKEGNFYFSSPAERA